MKLLSIVSFALVFLASSVSLMAAPLDDALLAIDTLPTKAQLDSISPSIQQDLRAASMDSNRSMYERRRAVTFLSYYPTVENRAHLLSVVKLKASKLSRDAGMALAITYGSSATADEVDAVASLFDGASFATEFVLAQSLTEMKNPRVSLVLKQLSFKNPHAAKLVKQLR